MHVKDTLIGILMFTVLLLGAHTLQQALVSAHLVAAEHEASSCEVVAQHTEEK